MKDQATRRGLRGRAGWRIRGAAIAVAALSTVGVGVVATPAHAYLTSFEWFDVRTHVQNKGWTTGVGSEGQGLRLEAISVTAQRSVNLCMRAHVATIGWQATKCTSASNPTIVVGTTGRSLAIEAVEVWIPGYTLAVDAHIQNIGDTHRYTNVKGGHVIAGTTGRGLRMETFVLQTRLN